jgi:6-phosphogluconolactonase
VNDRSGPSTQGVHGPRVQFHAHKDAGEWSLAAASAISDALAHDLEQRPRARLLLSGGSTPAPVYTALSKTQLAWDRVDVALVDERWLLPDDPDSNARLIRETLLQNNAASARFEAMTRPGRGIEETVTAANMHARQPAGVVVLASLFPRMSGLDEALHSESAYVAVNASGCAGAGKWLRRISLTPAGLATAHTRLLLIRGERKRILFDKVLSGDDAREYPVRVAFTTPGATLQVHWCP